MPDREPNGGSSGESDLSGLTHRQVMELFARLEAPGLTEMNGEYARRFLAQARPGMKWVFEGALNNPVGGTWLGKAFNGAGAEAQTGQGYNYFRRRGLIVRDNPMLTTIAPSRFDGRPAFQLVYRAFHSLCGSVHMVDEIRRVDDGHYLGIGTYGFIRPQRMQPLPFELTGPEAPYAGDTGRPRAGFDLERALTP